MACIVKIKGREQFREFQTEEDARLWLEENKNNISVEEFTNPYTEKKELFLNVKDSHKSTVATIKAANVISFEHTKEVLTKTGLGDFDVEEYDKRSDALSLGKALSKLRVLAPDGTYKRLFPEFITSNWLNVITQRKLIQKLKELSGESINEELIDSERNLIFDELNIPKSWIEDGKLHKASEWYNLIKDKYDVIIEQHVFDDIDREVIDTNQKSMEIMLLGEIQHKIFENILKHPSESEEKIRERVIDIFNDFYKKYNSNKYNEVENPEKVIENVKLIFDDIYSSYYKTAITAKADIEKQFKSANPGAKISWISEQRITSDLDEMIGDKSKIRGKIDAILVVNGIPHIIDFKVSRKSYEEWDSAKKLKTDYTLAMYHRLLSKLGLPTSSSTIHVYNITLNKDNKATSGELISRTSEIKNNTKLQNNLNELFKAAVEVNELSSKVFENISNYVNTLFGKTSIKGRRDITIESMIEILRGRLQYSNGKYRLRYNIFDRETAALKTKIMEATSKDEANNKIKNIAEDIVRFNEEEFSIKYDTLISDMDEFLSFGKDINKFTSVHEDSKLANFYGAILYKYKSSNAKIIHSPLAKENGLIFIKTDTGIDIISVSPYDPFADYDQTQKNRNLFDAETSSNALKRTIGNVNITKALLVANELLKDSADSIDNVTTIQLGQAIGHRVRVKDLKYIADSACSLCKIDNNLTSKFTDPLVNVLNSWVRYFNWTNNISTKDGKKLNYSKIDKLSTIDHSKRDILKDILKSADKSKINDFTGFEKLNISQNLEILNTLKSILTSEFYTIFNNPSNVAISPETVLMSEIEKAIQVYSNNEVSDTFSLKRYSLASGTMLNSMDTIPDENVAIVRNAINKAFSTIGYNFNNFNSKNRALVQKLAESKGYSKFRQYTKGDLVYIYDNLYRTINEDNPELILKNPWTDNSLNSAEQEYIRFSLFHLNKRKYNWKSINDIDPNVLQDVDYYVPLVRADGIQRFRNADRKVDFLKFRSYFEEMKNKLVSSGDIFEEQIIERQKEANSFERFYNQFNIRRNKEVRKDTISRLGIESFSRDLETVMDQYIIADESQQEFDNNTIPLIRSVLYVSQFNTHITGKDQSVFNEFITKTAKNVIYNESVMDLEVQQYMKKLAPLRAAAFTIGLGFNIMNVPRELIMGFFTNIRSAALASYGKESFTLTDYLKAFGILTADVPGFIQNVTKVELLNEFYRMSNMTITEIPEQVTTNKTGVFASFNRFMSWSLTAPDYFNRMSIFIAQMIHDGTWDAHEVVTNPDGSKELKYDITKDKRFDIFVKYKGDFSKVPNSDKEKFNFQEALYNVLLEELNNELSDKYTYNKGATPFLQRAYTDRQRASIKSFADTSFGYYDNEVKAIFFKTAVGQIFKQFMAYMTGKKVQYFQAGSDQIARGGFDQLSDINGDKLWRIIDSDGNPVVKKDSELTDNERLEAKPILGWKGTYIEGIFQSYMNLLKDLGFNTWNSVTGKNPATWNKLWKDYFTRGNIRNSNLIQAWIDLLIGSMIMALLRILFFDDPEITGINYDKQLKQSSSLVQNLFNVVDGATSDFDIYNVCRQAIFVWESPTYGILQRTVQNFWRNFGDDDLNLAQATLISGVNSVGALRPLRPVVNWYEDSIKEE